MQVAKSLLDAASQQSKAQSPAAPAVSLEGDNLLQSVSQLLRFRCATPASKVLNVHINGGYSIPWLVCHPTMTISSVNCCSSHPGSDQQIRLMTRVVAVLRDQMHSKLQGACTAERHSCQQTHTHGLLALTGQSWCIMVQQGRSPHSGGRQQDGGSGAQRWRQGGGGSGCE